jgi:hypothetical protein
LQAAKKTLLKMQNCHQLLGKNTVGFTLNNEVWVPYYKCRFMGNPYGEISARYGESGGAAPYSIDIQFIRQRKDKLSALTISSSGSGTVTTIGNKIDSISVDFKMKIQSVYWYLSRAYCEWK